MILNNLRKSVEYYRQQLSNIEQPNLQQFELLKGLPFYSEWTLGQNNPKVDLGRNNSKADFNHEIGLPQKNGQPMPLFDYERLLFDTLQSNKHIWIKKATGLGVTEFMLRYMAWLCLSTNKIQNS